MENTKHFNLPLMPTGAVDWPAVINDSTGKIEVGRTLRLIAAEPLAKYDPFYLDNDSSIVNKAYKASNTTKVDGIWQSASTAAGAEGYGQIDGVIENESWEWNPGFVYVDASGNLTESVSSSRGIAGYAISPTEILIQQSAIPERIAKMSSDNLADILSDETGSDGGFVRATSPTINNPVITNINPGADFTITQNSVTPFVSENTGAVANTLRLRIGRVGVGVDNPGRTFHVLSTSVAHRIERRISTPSGTSGTAEIFATTTGDMVDGFGGILDFRIEDNTSGPVAIARVIWIRSGADNEGSMILATADGGIPAERIRITPKGNIGVSVSDFGTNATKTLAISNGTPPGSSVADVFQIYSADIAAGHAAAHIRNENDTIIKLYQQSAISDPSGGATQDAEARTAIGSILTVLRNNGLIAT